MHFKIEKGNINIFFMKGRRGPCTGTEATEINVSPQKVSPCSSLNGLNWGMTLGIMSGS